MTNLNQNGRSMIEMLGVLAIIGVLSVGGIAGYSKAMMKFKINKTIDQIAMTVTNIRTLYAQQTTYKGLEDKIAYDMGVVDDAMATSKTATSNKLTNVFGGNVWINTDKSGVKGEDSDAKGAFVVSLDGLPREACVSIATNDWGSNYSSGLLGIKAGVAASGLTAAETMACYVAGGTTDSVPSVATGLSCASSNSGPLTVAGAAAGCNCTTANTCTVSLKYY
jgi:Tfp pilus assembly protein PilE